AYAAIENLTAGTAVDTFQVNDGASLSGALNGGTGANTLNYSGYFGPITVNLTTKAATSIGSITSITNLIGTSSAADSLVGAATTNTWNITAANAGNINSTF